MSVQLWSSAPWREQAVGWIDRRLAEAGLARTGDVQQPRVRPWATVLRAPTTGGDVWMKAAGPATAFEAGLYELAASPVPASLDHNDLHQQNVLGAGPYRFYDWGDSVVAHAFAAMLVPSQVLAGPQLERARDAYLAAFADLAPPAQLVAELELACRVARIARTPTWERALRTAREQDEPIDPYFAHAPFEELAALVT
jgi:hypothetical protein